MVDGAVFPEIRLGAEIGWYVWIAVYVLRVDKGCVFMNDSVIRRIRKTIQLAENNPNTSESETAWSKVRQLLRQYNLTLEDVYEQRRSAVSQQLLPGDSEDASLANKLSWRNLIRIESEPRVTLQIVPDATVHSGRGVESMLNLFHSMYEQFMDRVWWERIGIVYKTKDFVSYRIIFQHGRITFYLVVPQSHQKAIVNAIHSVWPKVAVVSVDVDYSPLNPKSTVGAYVELRDHYYKATLVDRTQNAPYPSLMAAGRNVIGDDMAVLDIAFVPVSRRWQKHAKTARDKHRKGVDVKKRPNSLLDIAWVIGDFVSEVLFEKVMGFIDVMMGVEEKDTKEKLMPWELMARRLRPASEQKAEHAGFDTVIRIVSHSKHRPRAELTLSAIGTALKDVSLDNEFDMRRVRNSKRIIDGIVHNKVPLLRINGNILSVPECSQLYQLPSGALQAEFPEIERIQLREVDADPLLTKGGMLLGELTFKRKTVQIYQPTNNWDEVCLPNVAIAGMGQGKTRGYLSNWLVEAYLNGFGGLAIDAAKREIGDQIQHAVDKGIIPADDFVRINLGTTPMSLDWKEAMYHQEGKSRLASTIIDFFAIEEDTTGQTRRFLRAAAMAMKTGKLAEIIDILDDDDRIEQAVCDLAQINAMAHKTMLQYQAASLTQRKQYASPIYNRIDLILGDVYLAKCMESDFELNLIDLMSQKKIVVFDLPDDELIGSQIDVIVNLLSSKIDIAMRMRAKVHGKQAEFPFFVCMDEPHKYMRSAQIWEAACVESRKWRVGYVWSFHYWEQIPPGLRAAIKNALPHYHLYASSKQTWESFAEEIKPFTVEDGLKLRRFHAINIIRAGDGCLTPVMVKMAPPPEKRF
jgi:hypothetical protein